MDQPTAKRTGPGNVTAATWQWYSVMDAAVWGQHAISPPPAVAAYLPLLPLQVERSAHWPLPPLWWRPQPATKGRVAPGKARLSWTS